MSGSLSNPWTSAPFVAVDLEGTGAQDRDEEAILEIAAVPMVAGLPHMPASYSTLVNPQRPVGRRPWVSPGLTHSVLRRAPLLDDVTRPLAERINGRYLVGHNVGVDWRLLHRRVPGITPAGLIDTLRLARALGAPRRSLTALVDDLGLTATVHAADPAGQPHRALWDAAAAALLLPALIRRRWRTAPPLALLLAEAEVPMRLAQPVEAEPQPALF
ncbi:exonuclease domain-containing protein [Micromonospora sp. NPDC049366]|uniref:3'-5' exonuclease n=1 Tax=Micromonospora sp. NPDC049366 TaxID=3364271 RepID=UPI0037999F37